MTWNIQFWSRIRVVISARELRVIWDTKAIRYRCSSGLAGFGDLLHQRPKLNASGSPPERPVKKVEHTQVADDALRGVAMSGGSAVHRTKQLQFRIRL